MYQTGAWIIGEDWTAIRIDGRWGHELVEGDAYEPPCVMVRSRHEHGLICSEDAQGCRRIGYAMLDAGTALERAVARWRRNYGVSIV